MRHATNCQLVRLSKRLDSVIVVCLAPPQEHAGTIRVSKVKRKVVLNKKTQQILMRCAKYVKVVASLCSYMRCCCGKYIIKTMFAIAFVSKRNSVGVPVQTSQPFSKTRT